MQIAEQLKFSPHNHALFAQDQSGNVERLDSKEILWHLISNFSPSTQLLFKKVEGAEAEVEAPKQEESDDEDQMSIYSVDGEVIVFFGEKYERYPFSFYPTHLISFSSFPLPLPFFLSFFLSFFLLFLSFLSFSISILIYPLI